MPGIDLATPLTLPCGAVMPRRLARRAMTQGLAAPQGRAAAANGHRAGRTIGGRRTRPAGRTHCAAAGPGSRPDRGCDCPFRPNPASVQPTGFDEDAGRMRLTLRNRARAWRGVVAADGTLAGGPVPAGATDPFGRLDQARDAS
ncbi:MAG: hypothetical protein ACI82N_000549 [Maricaulis sp.]|jgi:hypothetical protein